MPPVLRLHSTDPLAPLNAYTLLSLLPTYSRPSGPTHTDDSKKFGDVKLQRNAPVLPTSAYNTLSFEPMYTVPSSPTAALDTIDDPVLYVHNTVPLLDTATTAFVGHPMYTTPLLLTTGEDATLPPPTPHACDHRTDTSGPPGPDTLLHTPLWRLSRPN